MRRSGSITVKRACFISVQPTLKHSFCTRIIRPGISITRRIPSEAGTHRQVQTTFARSPNQLSDAGSVLITGPANAKTELVEFIRLHDPKLAKVIAGVETVDHPTDAQLVAYARKYLKAADRMVPC